MDPNRLTLGERRQLCRCGNQNFFSFFQIEKYLHDAQRAFHKNLPMHAAGCLTGSAEWICQMDLPNGLANWIRQMDQQNGKAYWIQLPL